MSQQDHGNPFCGRVASGLEAWARPPDNADPCAGDWRVLIEPLGVSTLIIADDPALLNSACAAFADWVVAAPAPEPGIEIRLELGDTAAGKVSDAIRVEGSRLTLAGAGIAGVADAQTGRAHCVVPMRLRDDAAALADDVLDPLLLFLLARMGRPPLHAAGLVLGNAAVLLAGPSGSGKSTLALAGAAQGLQVLSDDTVHVQLAPTVRVWGFARPIHVHATEAPPGTHRLRDRAGRRKAAVELPPALGQRRYADRAMLIVLDRGHRLALDRITTEQALSALMPLDPGFDLLPREVAAATRAVAADGAWRLMLTDDPAGAITLLRSTLATRRWA